MALQWFYRIGNQEIGPVNSAALKELADVGTVHRETLVRPTDHRDWHNADEVHGLFATGPVSGMRDSSILGPATVPP